MGKQGITGSVKPYVWEPGGCWHLNPCFAPFSDMILYAWQTILFWTYMAIQLIWAYFHWNRTNLKIWPLHKRSMTLFNMVIYLDNVSLYKYHVIDFFPPMRGTIRHALQLNWSILNFPMGGVSLSSLEGQKIKTIKEGFSRPTSLARFHDHRVNNL